MKNIKSEVFDCNTSFVFNKKCLCYSYDLKKGDQQDNIDIGGELRESRLQTGRTFRIQNCSNLPL